MNNKVFCVIDSYEDFDGFDSFHELYVFETKEKALKFFHEQTKVICDEMCPEDTELNKDYFVAISSRGNETLYIIEKEIL